MASCDGPQSVDSTPVHQTSFDEYDVSGYACGYVFEEDDVDDRDDLRIIECVSTFDDDEVNYEQNRNANIEQGDNHTDGATHPQDLMAFHLPPQLHPAAAMGIRRMSSCYFSIKSSEGNGSAADLSQLLDDVETENIDLPTSSRTHSRTSLFDAKGEVQLSARERGNEAALHLSGGERIDEFPDGMRKEDRTVSGEQADVSEDKSESSKKWNAVHVLYHDIMMHVFTFLDAQSLTAFSETARRPNFECFYFLQLQLQRALLVAAPSLPQLRDAVLQNTRNTTSDTLSSIDGSGAISRLAAMDIQSAQLIVKEYVNSNSTLRTMPLSHSIAYIRHMLHKGGFSHHPADGRSPTNAVASAAVLVAFMGAASFMGGTSSDYSAALRHALPRVALAGGLMKAGVKAHDAAKKMAEEEENGSDRGNGRMASMMGTMEQMARMFEENFHLPNLPVHQPPHIDDHHAQGESEEQTEDQRPHSLFPSSIAARLYSAFCSAYDPAVSSKNPTVSSSNFNDRQASSAEPTFRELQPNDTTKREAGSPRRRVRGQRSRLHRHLDRVDEACLESKEDQGEPSASDKLTGAEHQTRTPQSTSLPQLADSEVHVINFAMENPISSNPYEHLPASYDLGTCSVVDRGRVHTLEFQDNPFSRVQSSKKMPSGSVGAYTRAVRQAAKQVTKMIKDKRKANFMSLSEDERNQLSASFIDACASDDTLSIVRDIVQKQNAIDVDGFYAGGDGTKTCALHTAAFNGASQVLSFLCGGIDEFNPCDDRGLCDINIRDENGWTAMHFSAGANCVEAVRVLASNGANLSVEASNGYTPYHWAERLSNGEVVEELQRLGADKRFWTFGSSAPGSRRAPFASFFANGFFALIPSH